MRARACPFPVAMCLFLLMILTRRMLFKDGLGEEAIATQEWLRLFFCVALSTPSE